MQLSVSKIIKEFGEQAGEVAIDVLNDVIHDVVTGAKENLKRHHVKGSRMYENFEVHEATMKNEEALLAVEVWSDKPTKKIGNYNTGIYDSLGYANVGRIIEFSTRINKPFFYDAFYKRRKGLEDEIHDKVVEVIKNVNNKTK